MIHNPKHPGLMVKSLCIDPLGLSVTEAAEHLQVARSTLSKLLNGRMSISPEMAVRLSIVFKCVFQRRLLAIPIEGCHFFRSVSDAFFIISNKLAMINFFLSLKSFQEPLLES